MKNLFDKLKNTFGLAEEEKSIPPAEPATQYPPVAIPESDHSRFYPHEKTKQEPPLAVVSVSLPPENQEKEQPKAAVHVKPPVKKTFFPESTEKREAIIGFIINSLKPYVDESGLTISAMRLYILCTDNAEEETARIALHADKPGFFRSEKLERKLQNSFILLAENWSFSYELVTGHMPDCIFSKDDMGLDVFINQHTGHNKVTATLRVLTGQTAETEYMLDSSAGKPYCIGRGYQPQLSSGKLHTNDIVFLNREDPGFDEKKGQPNVYVSRDHAIIAFNPSFNRFLLYADKGVLPESGNKTKIFKANNKVERVDIGEIGHELTSGDQIELGGGAKLLFMENGG